MVLKGARVVVAGALNVVCLCADWCSACRAWRSDWDCASSRWAQHRWHWLDIEDEPDLMDAVGLDIETFPTVLITRGAQALFLGAIPPRPAFLDDLVARLGRDDATPQGVSPAAQALARHLHTRGSG